MGTCRFTHRTFPLKLGKGIKAFVERSPDRRLLPRRMRGGAGADGVDRGNMHQTPDSMSIHGRNERVAKHDVDSGIVVVAEQAHVRHTRAVDNSVATRGGLQEGVTVSDIAFNNHSVRRIDLQRSTAAHHCHHTVAGGGQLLQHIVPQQARCSKQQHFHTSYNAILPFLLHPFSFYYSHRTRTHTLLETEAPKKIVHDLIMTNLTPSDPHPPAPCAPFAPQQQERTGRSTNIQPADYQHT